MENENVEKKRAPRDPNDNTVFIGNKPFKSS